MNRQSKAGRLVTVLLLLWGIAASAAVTRDKPGDFEDADVVAVDTRISGQSVTITIQYAGDQIGQLYGGAGGTISIDADQNPATGVDGSPGFDCEITFTVLALAPQAAISILTGPQAGQTVGIDGGLGNGTNLAFTSNTVSLTVPLNLVSAGRDFDYVLFATGMFSVGDNWDRVPDTGVARASTGEVRTPTVPGGQQVAEHVLQAIPVAGKTPMVARVTTRLEGANAVWEVETNVDLPTNALDFQNTQVLTLSLDTDRRLETGIESGGVPLLPFGPDRSVRCTLMPGSKSGTIQIVTGITPSGERTYAGGGAGVNDLQCTFTRRKARIVVPLALIDAQTPGFDWMLYMTNMDRVDGPFMGSSIEFDTGQVKRPLAMPAHAVTVADPVDADPLGANPGENPGAAMPTIPVPPNSELTGLRAGLTRDYLLADIVYQKPIVGQPEYFTRLHIRTSGQRDYFLAMNWSTLLGGQIVVSDMSPDADPAKTWRLDSCQVIEGTHAYVLIPAAGLRLAAFESMGLIVDTATTLYKKGPPGQLSPAAPKGATDRIPDTGYVLLKAR